MRNLRLRTGGKTGIGLCAQDKILLVRTGADHVDGIGRDVARFKHDPAAVLGDEHIVGGGCRSEVKIHIGVGNVLDEQVSAAGTGGEGLLAGVGGGGVSRGAGDCPVLGLHPQGRGVGPRVGQRDLKGVARSHGCPALIAFGLSSEVGGRGLNHGGVQVGGGGLGRRHRAVHG